MHTLAEPVQTTKEAWWAGYRAGKGLPADTPRQEALTAPPADDEAVRLLREARDYVSDVAGNSREMYEKYPLLTRKWKPHAELLAAIDAYLAKKC